MGGGGTTTNTTNVPPPSENELKLQEKQLELSELQIAAVRQQGAFNEKLWQSFGPALDAQRRLIEASVAATGDPNSPENLARLQREQKIQDLYSAQELQRAERGGGATDSEIANLRAAADAAIEAGGRDIDRSQSDALEMLREEFAPSAGLRATDSPVMFRADKALREGLRLKGDLTSRIRAGEATARLNAPAGTAQLYGALGEGRASMAQAASMFTADLRESAAANRLRLAGSYGDFVNTAGKFGLGLATGVPIDINSSLGGYRQERFGQATTTSTTRRSLGFSDFAGPLASMTGAAIMRSSAELKDILATYGPAEAEKFLAAIVGLPIHHWRYKAGVGLDAESLHVGPTAEDWQAATGYGSRRTIAIPDMLGVLVMSIQALQARVAELEADAV